VLRLLVPVVLATAPAMVAAAAPALSTAAWWEKVTVTMTGDGKAQSCSYETSTAAAKPKECSVVGGEGLSAQSGGTKSEYTKITFERRFHPGSTPLQDAVQAGDTLLGKQVMSLAIDGGGKVSGCKIVAAAGDLKPEYGCEEASAEHFEADRGSAANGTREGIMSILIYGHSEQVA
jgi:hypothetical protein